MRRIAWVALLVLVSGQVRPTVLDKDDAVRVGDTRAFIREQIMAVKTTRWTGGTDTNWETAANWSNGVPSTTEKDSVYVARTATTDLLLNIDRRTDNTNAGADFTVFEVEQGCNINVGTSSSRAIFTADSVFIYGGKNVYFDCETGSVGSTLVDKLVVDAPGTNVILDYNDGPTAADYMSGDITIESTAANNGPFSITMAQSRFGDSNARLTVQSGQSPVFEVEKLLVSAGHLIYDNTKSTVDVPDAIYSPNVINSGGVVEMKNGSSIYGYIQFAGRTIVTSAETLGSFTDVWLLGGVLDTRSFDSAFASPFSTIYLAPHAVWQGTAAQAAAVTINRIGE